MPPLLVPAISCLAGALGGVFLLGQAPRASHHLLLLCVGLALGSGLYAVLRPGRLASTVLFAVAVGGALGSLAAPVGPGLPSGTVTIRGRVAQAPRAAAPGCQMVLTRLLLQRGGGWRARAGSVRVRLVGECPHLPVGIRVQVRGRARTPRRGARGSVPGMVAPGSGVARLDAPDGGERAGHLARVRRWALARLRPEQGPGRALLAALLVGVRGWITPAKRGRFRASGTAHLLAISGLHVGLVALLVFALLRRLLPCVPALVRRVPAQMVASAVAVPLTWAYVGLSGAALPAQRAGIMATALLLAPLLGRRADPWAGLALAALITTCRDATAWLRPGCQLSYVAVAGILWGAARMPRWLALPKDRSAQAGRSLPRLGRWLRRLGQTAWVSGVAVVATAPLVAVHFGAVAGAGVVVNLLALPLLALWVLPLGLLGLAASALVPPLGSALLQVAAVGAQALEAVVCLGAQHLGHTLTPQVSLSPFGAAVAYGALLGSVLVRIRPGRWLLGASLLLSSLLWARASLGPGAGRGYRVEVLAVGDGDAILITFPGNRFALVDAPGSVERPGRSAALVATLRRRGVERFAFVLATHPHADHVGGLPAVLAAFPTAVLFYGGQVSSEPEWERVLEAAHRHGVQVRRARSICIASVCVEVLWPRQGARVAPWPSLTVNDNSVVVRLQGPGGRVLLAGDLEGDGERALLARGISLRADLLKVAHHGRASASTLPFLRAVSPRLALVSAGPGALAATRRPHGPSRVEHRLRRVGARLLSTAREGDLSVELAPWGIRVRTAAGRDEWLRPEAPVAPLFPALLSGPRSTPAWAIAWGIGREWNRRPAR